MEFQDRPLECVDCHQPFTFTAGEQAFYAQKGFREEPKRCKPCRENRKSRREDPPRETARESNEGPAAPEGTVRRPSAGGRTREMFDAVCAACGSPTRVPFRPTAGRPVYCRDCHANRSSGG
jgi:CxxC-x17-CxxC domain-containing protein